MEVDDTKLFGQEYKKVNEGSWATVDGNGDVVVKAATGNDKNVIAPGTTGSMTISVTGNAEVAAELTVAMNATSVPTFVVTTGESDSTVKYTYSPVKFQVKVGGEAQEISSGTDKTVGTLEDVKSYLETTSNWGFTPYTEINKEFEIVWEWALQAKHRFLRTASRRGHCLLMFWILGSDSIRTMRRIRLNTKKSNTAL